MPKRKAATVADQRIHESQQSTRGRPLRAAVLANLKANLQGTTAQKRGQEKTNDKGSAKETREEKQESQENIPGKFNGHRRSSTTDLGEFITLKVFEENNKSFKECRVRTTTRAMVQEKVEGPSAEWKEPVEMEIFNDDVIMYGYRKGGRGRGAKKMTEYLAYFNGIDDATGDHVVQYCEENMDGAWKFKEHCMRLPKSKIAYVKLESRGADTHETETDKAEEVESLPEAKENVTERQDSAYESGQEETGWLSKEMARKGELQDAESKKESTQQKEVTANRQQSILEDIPEAKEAEEQHGDTAPNVPENVDQQIPEKQKVLDTEKEKEHDTAGIQDESPEAKRIKLNEIIAPDSEEKVQREEGTKAPVEVYDNLYDISHGGQVLNGQQKDFEGDSNGVMAESEPENLQEMGTNKDQEGQQRSTEESDVSSPPQKPARMMNDDMDLREQQSQAAH